AGCRAVAEDVVVVQGKAGGTVVVDAERAGAGAILDQAADAVADDPAIEFALGIDAVRIGGAVFGRDAARVGVTEYIYCGLRVVCIPTPAASPPSLESLQSMVTLLVPMVMAMPVVTAVVRSCLKHQVPWVLMTVGSEVMKPVQVW